MPTRSAIRPGGPGARSSTGGSKRRGDRPGTSGAKRLVIVLKRVYDRPSASDGGRVLVDRVWPRGVSKEKIRLAAWLGDLGPSARLRKWFGHDPEKWQEFRRRYQEELLAKRALLDELTTHARHGNLTLLFGARDPVHNQAVVIKEVLERRLARQRVTRRKSSRTLF
jgi:uncharacterized protein YeaO (DUF488 family)